MINTENYKFFVISNNKRIDLEGKELIHLIKGNNNKSIKDILESFRLKFPRLKESSLFISEIDRKEYKKLLGKRNLYIIN